MRTIILVFLISCANCVAQTKEPYNLKDPIVYLIKNVLLANKDSGSVVLLPLDAKDIKHFLPGQQVKYWGIVGNYFPTIPKDALEQKVTDMPWINQSIFVKGFTIHYPNLKVGEVLNLGNLYKEYNYTPIYRISHPIYSKDLTTCIIYVVGYQEGAFTVEIKKDVSQKWTSHIMTTDWLE